MTETAKTIQIWETNELLDQLTQTEARMVGSCLTDALEMVNNLTIRDYVPTIAGALRDFAWRQRLDTDPAALLAELAEAIGQAAVAMAAGMTCPACDGPTRPDPDRPGARYCDACQEPVLYGPGPMTQGAAAEIAGLVDALDAAFNGACAEQLAEIARLATWAAMYACRPVGTQPAGQEE